MGWRCGGSIIVVPCSRIGHLFRDPEYRPYDVDIPQVVENYAKVARVWLEPPYLEAFYKVKPEARAMALDDPLKKARSNFKKLKCKSMKWYVENVDIELWWEATRICIPGNWGPTGCEKEAAFGRSTIDRIISPEEFMKQTKRSEERFFDPKMRKKYFGDLVVPLES